jgi:hypothetical protein
MQKKIRIIWLSTVLQLYCFLDGGVNNKNPTTKMKGGIGLWYGSHTSSLYDLLVPGPLIRGASVGWCSRTHA